MNIPPRIYRCETKVFCTFSFEGVHQYPYASTAPELADVSFLGDRHRHIFHVRAAVTVGHQDREIEFIQLKRYLKKELPIRLGQFLGKPPETNGEPYELGSTSCEMLAGLVSDMVNDYVDLVNGSKALLQKGRVIEVEVSEDEENGAVLRKEFM